MIEETEWWVRQLDEWFKNGTFSRLGAAMEAQQPVRVPRTDGSSSIGVITATSGFGGRVINLRIDGEDRPLYKAIDTDYFLEANPGFGPSLLELRPKEERKKKYGGTP
jgi:hypothetical protein